MARLMRMTIVALAIMGLLPLAASAQMIGFVERTQEDIDTNVTFERDKCMRAAPGHLTLTSTEDIPAGTQVTYVVRTVEGHDIFRNHGVQVLLAEGSTLSELKGNVITATTTGAGTDVHLPGLCWADNRIDGSRGEGPSGQYYSVIEIQLVSVSGFSIDFASSRARYAITDEDYCHNPNFLPQNQGRVYRIRNGRTCTCTEKSRIVQQGIASGETESYATTALKWRTDSTNYCPDSPYQRP
ncbi:MAG: hypothetical protein OXF72_11855 [Gammaproteobacteria bacterium]|nr:hypothetical protein [Gammaproteobacteria bacterium]